MTKQSAEAYGICHIYFVSDRGRKVAERTSFYLSKAGSACHLLQLHSKPGKALITLKEFRASDAMIFIASTGIAVRAIASYVKDKQKDPAVIVIDESSKYVVPVLGGHIKRGNELAVDLAKVLKAEAVVTTASDNLNTAALDVFAETHGLKIRPASNYKNIATRLNAGEKATLKFSGRIGTVLSKDQIKKLMELSFGLPVTSGPIICVTEGEISPAEKASCDLVLSPKKYSIGIGFRKDIAAADLLKVLRKVLKEIAKDAEKLSGNSKKANKPDGSNTLIKADISNQADLTNKILCITTIDIKKGSSALTEAAKTLGIPVKYYTAAKLQKTINADPAGFSVSKAAQKNIGIDGVSEPAAVLAASNGKLIMKKRVLWGITVAVARENCL